MARITEAAERRLRRKATPRGAKGYADWILENAPKSNAGERTAEALAERRSEIGYGRAGERLYASPTANDGYAAYLQAAAKEARAARTEQRESAAVAEGRAALAGYAAYLDGLREQNGDTLVSAAKELAGISDQSTDRREEIVTAATADPAARAALRQTKGKEGADEGEDENARLTETLSYIKSAALNYDEAYELCLVLGYNATRAKEIARQATAKNDALSAELNTLFDE